MGVATLLPSQPPGRLTRKARHYLPQIVQLRTQGYTLEAIQQALAAAGVPVSISTVRREAMRPVPAAPPPVAATAVASIATARTPANALSAGPVVPAASTLTPGLSNPGKDVAAAFAQSKSSNPLSRAKETP
jgi:hypothetical protein